MNFNRGEQVVHRDFGVGKVVSIEGMNFTGNQPRLFYQVEFNKTTVWVPVGNQPSGGLRPITPKNQLYRFRTLLKSSPTRRSEDFNDRRIGLEILIQHGSFRSLCEIVRDLSAWSQLKPLNNYEKSVLKSTRSALVTEWSVTSGLSPEHAFEEIDGCLKKGSQSETSD